MKPLRILGILATVLCIAGCEEQVTPEIPQPEKPLVVMYVRRVPVAGGKIIVTRLADGTRCAVYDGLDGDGGISCDWPTP